MATTVIEKKRTARIALDNGTDSDGNQLYKYTSVPYIYTAGWDADKFMAVASSLGPVLDNETMSCETTTVSSITTNA